METEASGNRNPQLPVSATELEQLAEQVVVHGKHLGVQLEALSAQKLAKIMATVPKQFPDVKGQALKDLEAGLGRELTEHIKKDPELGALPPKEILEINPAKDERTLRILKLRYDAAKLP